MIPILHEATSAKLENYGLGALQDAISCKVRQEINGAYTLSMEYPTDGRLANELIPERIIWAVPEEAALPQPFAIASTQITMGRTIKIEAEHISYRLNGRVVGAFSAYSAPQVVSRLSDAGSGFTFWTDLADIPPGDSTILEYNAPGQIRARLNDAQKMYGGELEWDGLAVRWRQQRGQDRGVQILYGKNLSGLQQTMDNSGVATALYPYAVKKDGTLITLPEETMETGATLGYDKVIAVDLTDQIEDFSETALRVAAESVVYRGVYKNPTVSVKVNFVALRKTEEYKSFAAMERVKLGDTVHVGMESLGISVSARVKELTFDVLRETYDTVSIGSEMQTLPKMLASATASQARSSEESRGAIWNSEIIMGGAEPNNLLKSIRFASKSDVYTPTDVRIEGGVTSARALQIVAYDKYGGKGYILDASYNSENVNSMNIELATRGGNVYLPANIWRVDGVRQFSWPIKRLACKVGTGDPGSWSFVMYEGHSCELWISVKVSESVPNAMGSWYATKTLTLPDYPFEVVNPQVYPAYTLDDAGGGIAWAVEKGSTEAPPKYRIIRPTAVARVGGWLCLYVKGEYKAWTLDMP